MARGPRALWAWASAGLADVAGAGLDWRGAMAVGGVVAALLWLTVWRAPMPMAAERPALQPEGEGDRPVPGLVAGQGPSTLVPAASAEPPDLGAPD